MKKITILFTMLFVLILCGTSEAQTYKSAIGVRGPYPVAASYKFFISDPAAIELYLGFYGYSAYGGFTLGGMYQHHFPIGQVPGLSWYIGGGAGLAFWNYRNIVFLDEPGRISFNVNAVGGVDYKFETIPLNVSADFQPTIRIGGYSTGFYPYGGVAARYVLK